MRYAVILLASFILFNIQSIGQPHTFDNPPDNDSGYGYLKISANIDWLYIVIDNDFSEYYEFEKDDSLRLPAGQRNIVIASPYAYDSRHTVDIKPDSTHTINIRLDTNISEQAYRNRSSYPRLMWNANVIVHTDTESEIIFQGETIGYGSAALDLPEGHYTFTTKHPDAGRKNQRVQLRQDRLTVLDMYVKPDQKSNRFYSIIPGASQLYKNQPLKGALIAGGAALIGYFSYDYIRQYNDTNNLYNETLRLYRDATVESEALYYGDRAEELYDEARSYASTRDIFLIAGALFYAFNIWDAWRQPASGFRATEHPDPYQRSRIMVGYNPEINGMAVNFSFTF